MMGKSAIFIVEDEAIVANDIKETLKSLGYDVKGIAKSGEIALEKIKELKKGGWSPRRAQSRLEG